MSLIDYALVVTALPLAVAAFVLFIALKLTERKNKKLQNALADTVARLQQKQTLARQIGVNQTLGDYSQILGTFSLLTEYDEIIVLSSTSAQSSLDLMGIKDNKVDFIELKKAGADLTPSERRLRNLIRDNKLIVRYRIVDVTLPNGAAVTTRKIVEGGQTQL